MPAIGARRQWSLPDLGRNWLHYFPAAQCAHARSMNKTLPEGGATSSASALLSPRYRTWFVVMLLLISVLNFADRAILAVLAQPIKEDLKLSDADIGMLQGLGFAILYSVLGLPLGWLAERVSRKGLLSACVAIWSLMTTVCGFATNFVTLLLGRIGVGVGEAGFLPPTYSLVSDHFPPNRRASVMSIVLLGAPFGFLLGQSVGGWVASEWNWRVAFYALGVPGLVVALIAWLTLREPPRGLAEGWVVAGPAPSMKEVFSTLWSKPTFRHLLFGFTISSFVMNAVASFVLPFYLRSFGLPLAVAGAVFGVVTFSSNGLGMLVGGFGFDRLSRRDVRWPLWGPAAMLVIATPMFFWAFASSAFAVSLAFVWVANFALASHMAPTSATFQNMAGPRMRALTYAIVATAVNLLGAGLGPTLLGVASDHFATQSFAAGQFLQSCPGGRAAPGAAAGMDAACQAASTHGLRLALLCSLVFFLWAAVHYVLASRTLKRDLYAPPAA
jgi:predicted MFS family arabinose efflux permease